MEPVRPLRDVLAALSAGQVPPLQSTTDADPGRLLAEHGHPGLADGLLAEAIVNYADTAPLEVAEHLAPFVVAHSPVPLRPDQAAATGADGPDGPSIAHGLALLSTAPHGPVGDDPTVPTGLHDPVGLDAGHHPVDHLVDHPVDHLVDHLDLVAHPADHLDAAHRADQLDAGHHPVDRLDAMHPVHPPDAGAAPAAGRLDLDFGHGQGDPGHGPAGTDPTPGTGHGAGFDSGSGAPASELDPLRHLHVDPLHADPLHADTLHADTLHADPFGPDPTFDDTHLGHLHDGPAGEHSAGSTDAHDPGLPGQLPPEDHPHAG